MSTSQRVVAFGSNLRSLRDFGLKSLRVKKTTDNGQQTRLRLVDSLTY